MIKVQFEIKYRTDGSDMTIEDPHFVATIKVIIPRDSTGMLPLLLRQSDATFFGFTLTPEWGVISDKSPTLVYSFIFERGDDLQELERRVNSLVTMEKNRLITIYKMNKAKVLSKPKTTTLILE